MLRFSIRDVLWLTALAAVLVAWWIQHRLDGEARQQDSQAIVELKKQLAARPVVRVVQLGRPAPARSLRFPQGADLQMPPQRPVRLDPWP